MDCSTQCITKWMMSITYYISQPNNPSSTKYNIIIHYVSHTMHSQLHSLLCIIYGHKGEKGLMKGRCQKKSNQITLDILPNQNSFSFCFYWPTNWFYYFFGSWKDKCLHCPKNFKWIQPWPTQGGNTTCCLLKNIFDVGSCYCPS